MSLLRPSESSSSAAATEPPGTISKRRLLDPDRAATRSPSSSTSRRAGCCTRRSAEYSTCRSSARQSPRSSGSPTVAQPDALLPLLPDLAALLLYRGLPHARPRRGDDADAPLAAQGVLVVVHQFIRRDRLRDVALLVCSVLVRARAASHSRSEPHTATALSTRWHNRAHAASHNSALTHHPHTALSLCLSSRAGMAAAPPPASPAWTSLYC